jgi:hypothetical protein
MLIQFKPTSSAVIGPNSVSDKEASGLSVASSDKDDDDDGNDNDRSGDGTCSSPLFGNMLSGCANAK